MYTYLGEYNVLTLGRYTYYLPVVLGVYALYAAGSTFEDSHDHGVYI